MFENCSHILSDPERLQALANTALMDTPAEESFQRLNRLASMVLKAPISIFSLIGNDRQYFKSTFGLPSNVGAGVSVPLDVSVCQFALQGKPLALDDTRNHPFFKDNPAVKAMDIAGYLGIPLVTKDGFSIGTVCVFDHARREWTQDEIQSLQEITNSFLTEIELRVALRKSEKETKLREEFMSIASHELKTPLSTLMLHTQIAQKKLLLDSFGKTEMENLLRQYDRQFKRLHLLINDMFDVSSIAFGKFSLTKERVHLNELIEDILSRFCSQLEDAGCKYTFIAEKEFIGQWDPFRIEQVISNLLTNVIKYSSGQPLTITLTNDRHSVKIEFADNGPGMSKEVLEKIFQPFERFNKDQSISGLGLGLYISKQIMREHGGDLIAEDSGHGSRFTLILPFDH